MNGWQTSRMTLNNMNKITKEDLVKYLVANFKNEKGIIDLSGLNFKGEDICGVDISRMQVGGRLNQGNQEVDGDLYQGRQKVKETLTQNQQNVEGSLWQDYQKVEGNIFQSSQNAGENIFQADQVYGDSIFSTPQDWINSVLLEREVESNHIV